MKIQYTNNITIYNLARLGDSHIEIVRKQTENYKDEYRVYSYTAYLCPFDTKHNEEQQVGHSNDLLDLMDFILKEYN